MCYFIHLKVCEQGKVSYAERAIQEIIKGYDLTIYGDYPNYIITDGMCSCKLVKNYGNKIEVDISLFKKILSNSAIKYIEIGWSWGDSLRKAANKLRMDIKEFIDKNEKAELEQDVWYHINEFDKYR